MFNLGFRPIFLSDDFNIELISDKIIYLVPFNDVTSELYYELKKLNPKKLTFVDNYQCGENIIKPSDIKAHDFIFLYSPNFHGELSKSLPNKKLYFLYKESKKGYKFRKYSRINFLLTHFHKNLYDLRLNIEYKFRFNISSKYGIYLNKNEKRLVELKNIHEKKRAFIIGNGPSLNINDLKTLKNEITFASNKI